MWRVVIGPHAAGMRLPGNVQEIQARPEFSYMIIVDRVDGGAEYAPSNLTSLCAEHHGRYARWGRG